MSLGTLNFDPIESATIAYQIKEEFPEYEQTPIWDALSDGGQCAADLPTGRRQQAEEVHETFTFDLPEELTTEPA